MKTFKSTSNRRCKPSAFASSSKLSAFSLSQPQHRTSTSSYSSSTDSCSDDSNFNDEPRVSSVLSSSPSNQPISQRSLPALSPSLYLHQILTSRGYDTTPISGLLSSYRITPTPWHLSSYDHPLLEAVRQNDHKRLVKLFQSGVHMQACNLHCESVLHIAARKSTKEVVQFLLSHGALCFVDDAGRLPMHDVCWRQSPNFDLVMLLLEHDLAMMRIQDRFGACPLDYVNPRQWPEWCEFLDSIKDKFWPIRTPESETQTPLAQLKEEPTNSNNE
jgi:hypothetical protein